MGRLSSDPLPAMGQFCICPECSHMAIELKTSIFGSKVDLWQSKPVELKIIDSVSDDKIVRLINTLLFIYCYSDILAFIMIALYANMALWYFQ